MRHFIYFFTYLWVTFINFVYFHVKVTGRENLPKKGPYILAGNHRSNLDPSILGYCQMRYFSYMAKEELFKKPIIGWYIRILGAFPIKRESADLGALKTALKRLKQGRPLILFPEGTRGAQDQGKKAQPGVGFIVKKAQVPVVPAYIKGSDKVMPPGAKWFRRHPVTVTIGQPIQFDPNLSREKVAAKILEAIYALGAR